MFYPNCSLSTINYNKSFTIQHCGIKFKKSEDGVWPYNFKNGDDISRALKKTTRICVLTGASFMIEKKKFEQVNGFCEEYIYGYEDVDLSLKLIKKGYCNYIVPSSIAIHKEFGTQSEQSSKELMERRINNKSRKNYRWYNVSEDTDIVISLLDSFNIDKIICKNKELIKIAWARNWFDRWISKSYIKNFDFIFAPSEMACEYMEKSIGIEANLLKIGTNDERFNNEGVFKEEFEFDYCFTGNYWDDYREIIDMIDFENYYNYKFKVFGENWNKIEKFKNVAYGFVNYNQIPSVYKSTKLIIDDANRATKPLGSVNSRVYDALCSGVLVITNGELGARLTFGDKLPVYESKEDLKEKIKFYLENDDKRIKLIEELKSIVIDNHTYDIRVQEFLDVLKKT